MVSHPPAVTSPLKVPRHLSYQLERFVFYMMTLFSAAATIAVIWSLFVLKLSWAYRLLCPLPLVFLTGYLLMRACRIIDYDHPTELKQVKQKIQSLLFIEASAFHGINIIAYDLYGPLFAPKFSEQMEILDFKSSVDLCYRVHGWSQACSSSRPIPTLQRKKFLDYCCKNKLSSVLGEASRVEQEKQLKKNGWTYWTLLQHFSLITEEQRGKLEDLQKASSRALAVYKASIDSIRRDEVEDREPYPMLLAVKKQRYTDELSRLEKIFQDKFCSAEEMSSV